MDGHWIEWPSFQFRILFFFFCSHSNSNKYFIVHSNGTLQIKPMWWAEKHTKRIDEHGTYARRHFHLPAYRNMLNECLIQSGKKRGIHKTQKKEEENKNTLIGRTNFFHFIDGDCDCDRQWINSFHRSIFFCSQHKQASNDTTSFEWYKRQIVYM